MKPDQGARHLRVGIFLTVALGLLVAVVFVLGRTQNLFSRKVTLHTSFENISGLVVGAPVRLAGVDIGLVEAIDFDKDLRVKKVHVKLGIESQYIGRIREDSIARLSSKGLLGDMIINITVGSADAAPLQAGGRLKSQELEGLTEVIESVQDAIGVVRHLAGDVDERLKTVLTDQFARDLGRIAHSTAGVMEKVEKGSGLAHALIYDPQLTRDTTALMGDARELVARAERAVGRVDHILAAVEKGPGTVHDLLYKDQGSRVLVEVERAARDLGGVVKEIQNGRGMLHSLIYEKEQRNLIENLTALSEVLRQVGEEVRQGKGTIGALLKDPTVYEDLKTILGNIKRNRLLKALVRFTIEKDGLKAATGKPQP